MQILDCSVAMGMLLLQNLTCHNFTGPLQVDSLKYMIKLLVLGFEFLTSAAKMIFPSKGFFGKNTVPRDD